MKTILKYPLEAVWKQKINTHKIIKILCVQNQGSNPCLWALVDTDSKKTTITIRMFFTGEDMRDCSSYYYLGTTQLNGLVLHWFYL
jgi:hypothetical protein